MNQNTIKNREFLKSLTLGNVVITDRKQAISPHYCPDLDMSFTINIDNEGILIQISGKFTDFVTEAAPLTLEPNRYYIHTVTKKKVMALQQRDHSQWIFWCHERQTALIYYVNDMEEVK